MSNALFPTLPGLKPTVGLAPRFATTTQRALSLRELRAQLARYPLWDVSLEYEFLRQGNGHVEMDTLRGFFLARGGSFDSFLFAAPGDTSVTDQQFGIGDGTTTAFQLVRTLGAAGHTFTEPVNNLNGAATIKKAGVTQGSGYSINSTGLVTFTTAPTSGQSLTWSGAYYWRVRFTKDEADLRKFLEGLWDLRRLDLVGSVVNKV